MYLSYDTKFIKAYFYVHVGFGSWSSQVNKINSARFQASAINNFFFKKKITDQQPSSGAKALPTGQIASHTLQHCGQPNPSDCKCIFPGE